MASDIAKNMRLALGPQVSRLSPDLRAVVERGGAIPARVRRAALRSRRIAVADLAPVTARYALIIAPGALNAAPVGQEDLGDPVMCRAWTMLDLPAANVPVGVDRAGLPMGVQAIGTERDDQAFLLNLISLEPSIVDRA